MEIEQENKNKNLIDPTTQVFFFFLLKSLDPNTALKYANDKILRRHRLKIAVSYMLAIFNYHRYEVVCCSWTDVKI